MEKVIGLELGADDYVGKPFDLRELAARILPGVTHWNHPGFMAYFAITSSAPGVLAEFLSAALNQLGVRFGKVERRPARLRDRADEEDDHADDGDAERDRTRRQ